MLEIHVIANGDVFREVFNAIVTLLGESTFKTAFRLSLLFAVFGVVFTYIRGRDLAVFGKWFVLYFIVTVFFLVPKTNIAIVDSSNIGATYTVDNVSYGLAFPASLITSVAYGLEKGVEEAFHMPDDATYSKTGMLFGSRVFGLSSGFHFINPDVKTDFGQYVKNCVLGDILINKKYSMQDLLNSADIWALISSNPSPVRGVFFKDGDFRTCIVATPILKNAIETDIKNNAWKFFGMRILSGKDETIVANNLQTILESASQYYTGISKSAAAIMQQNVLINGVRTGILDYATEAEATAAILNISSTESIQKMRMTWATSLNTITYMMPIMQTDLLLLLLCLFPIVILITVQPGFGSKVFKSYFYSLLWIESWPILFSFLNLAVTFYLKNKTLGIAVSGFTLSNSDQLALEHSDVANMAGYLMTCVPFVAGGIVKGMDSAFSSAAQYVGGMLHSTAFSASSEVTSKNGFSDNLAVNELVSQQENENLVMRYSEHWGSNALHNFETTTSNPHNETQGSFPIHTAKDSQFSFPQDVSQLQSQNMKSIGGNVLANSSISTGLPEGAQHDISTNESSESQERQIKSVILANAANARLFGSEQKRNDFDFGLVGAAISNPVGLLENVAVTGLVKAGGAILDVLIPEAKAETVANGIGHNSLLSLANDHLLDKICVAKDTTSFLDSEEKYNVPTFKNETQMSLSKDLDNFCSTSGSILETDPSTKINNIDQGEVFRGLRDTDLKENDEQGMSANENLREKIVAEAALWQGTKYAKAGTLYEGSHAKQGLGGDCSGIVHAVFQSVGYDMPYLQAKEFVKTSGAGYFEKVDKPQVGDVIAWHQGKNHHLAIYAGDGKMWTTHSHGHERKFDMDRVVNFEKNFKEKAEYYRLKE